ncbi:MAG: hypothetical protein ACUVQ3_09055 [bacterium]
MNMGYGLMARLVFFMLLILESGLNWGAEYNCSWNNGPDWIYIDITDTLGNPQKALIIHSEWSNEIGLEDIHFVSGGNHVGWQGCFRKGGFT